MGKNPYLPLFLLIILAIIWGSSFILMKQALPYFSAVQVGTLRIFIAFLVLLPFAIKHVLKVDRKHWWSIILMGVTGSGIPSILFATAQTKLSSSLAGVLNSLTPIFTLLIAFLFFAQKFTAKQIIGVALGLLGAIGLILIKTDGTFEINYFYGLLILIATLCYGISVNINKMKLQDVHPIAISSLAFASMGPFMGVYLFTQTNFTEIVLSTPEHIRSFIYIAILAIFGSSISLILFTKLVQLTNAVYASTVTYLIPIVALIWGVSTGESLGWIHLFGISAILGGVYIANKKEKTTVI